MVCIIAPFRGQFGGVCTRVGSTLCESDPPGISHTDLEQTQGILKGESGLFFDPCVNAMAWRPYCPSCMEVSYCTFGFDAFIRRDLRTLSLPRDSPRDNQYACVILVHAGKATHA